MRTNIYWFDKKQLILHVCFPFVSTFEENELSNALDPMGQGEVYIYCLLDSYLYSRGISGYRIIYSITI